MEARFFFKPHRFHFLKTNIDAKVFSASSCINSVEITPCWESCGAIVTKITPEGLKEEKSNYTPLIITRNIPFGLRTCSIATNYNNMIYILGFPRSTSSSDIEPILLWLT